MNNHQRVKGHSNLVRDRRTGVILNTNKTEIENSKKRSKIQQERQEHVNSLSAEVNGLKDDISQIKELLYRLLEDKK